MPPNETAPTKTQAATVVAQAVRDRTFVVIAAYNEGSVLAEVVREVQRSFLNVVVVDDGSTDETFNVARHSARYALRHAVNRGQGAALQTGIEFALLRGAAFIVTFDADGQHRLEDVDRLLEPVASGSYDITLGSRFLGATVNLPWTRRVMLGLGVLFTRIVNRMPLTDAHNGLRCFSRRAAEQITITADRMEHASELIDLIRKAKLPWCEIPVEIRYTEYSLAKGQSSGAALRIVFHYIMSRIVR